MQIANMMVLGLFLIAVGAPMAAFGQPAPGHHRIAFINVGPAAANTKNVAAFRAGLADLGYIEGRNLTIDYRWGDQKVDQLPALVNELLAAKPAVIVSTGGQAPIRAIKSTANIVPVVFITGDPVAEGFVRSLARPGGNMTGLAVLGSDLEAKRLELLTEIVPKARKIALVWNPDQPLIAAVVRNVEVAGSRLRLTLLPWQARNAAELETVFAEITKSRVDALFILADPVLGFERARIVDFVSKQRLPGIYFWREFADIGGLASYATNLPAVYRRTATYVDKILKGTPPGQLPVEQPTTFELVINLKTAKSIGISVPSALQQRADTLLE